MAEKSKQFTDLYTELHNKYGLIPLEEFYHMIRIKVPKRSEYYDDITLLLVVANDMKTILGNEAATIESMLPFKPPEFQLQMDLQMSVKDSKKTEELSNLRDEANTIYLSLADSLLFKGDYEPEAICKLVNEAVGEIKKINGVLSDLYRKGVSDIQKRLKEGTNNPMEKSIKTYFG